MPGLSTIVCARGRDAEAAGGDVLAEREVEEAGQVVERKHLLAADGPNREGPAGVARLDGVRGGRRRLCPDARGQAGDHDRGGQRRGHCEKPGVQGGS